MTLWTSGFSAIMMEHIGNRKSDVMQLENAIEREAKGSMPRGAPRGLAVISLFLQLRRVLKRRTALARMG